MFTAITNLNTVIHTYLQKLQGIRPGGKAYDDAMHGAADTALTASKARIHERGTAGDGSAIGQYSATPMYVSTSRTPAPGDAVGKTGKNVFASGRQHLSRYFPQGYQEYKTAAGLNDAGSVNLTLTGQMRDTYQVIQTSEGYGLGWPDTEMAKRAAALEEKYGKKIWMLTDEERKAVIDEVKERLL